MGIVSSAKERFCQECWEARKFQSPMGIVSSAKLAAGTRREAYVYVSIPDGDSFLREGLARYTALETNLGFNPRWG